MEGHEIARRRAALGLSQRRLADAVGVHQVTVARWETDVSTPRGLSARQLAATLDRLEADAARRAARRARYAVRTSTERSEPLE